ncbi:MAG: hypothetical protein IKB34_00220 [Clostridia bacterium]|nr:hypothetical protein [Clostridia bacterium]
MALTEEKKITDVDALLSATDDGDEEKMLVCFVCTGNTCRSPMAEAVLNHLGRGKYRAISAGTAACDGDRITENAAKALKRAGIDSTPENDYENHRATAVSYNTVVNCDKIVAMTSSHLMQLLMAFPDAADKMSVMPQEIPDPFMYGEAVYDRCLEIIIDGIREVFAIDG